jgi:hypothetical protein
VKTFQNLKFFFFFVICRQNCFYCMSCMQKIFLSFCPTHCSAPCSAIVTLAPWSHKGHAITITHTGRLRLLPPESFRDFRTESKYERFVTISPKGVFGLAWVQDRYGGTHSAIHGKTSFILVRMIDVYERIINTNLYMPNQIIMLCLKRWNLSIHKKMATFGLTACCTH